MEIINLTPHPIVLRSGAGDTTVPPSGTVARVSTLPGVEIQGTGLPVPAFSSPAMGEVIGLPSPTEGKVFVVSGLVAGALRGRTDVFSPGTGPADGAIRNEAGHIVAVTRLIQSPQ